ncbi:MAG: DUF177 domain-containing protein [Pseudomonadota bacterium]
MTQAVNEDGQPAPLTRKIKLIELEREREQTIELTPDERQEIMALLDLTSLDDFAFTYKAHSSSGKRVQVRGHLTANAVQTCVVSLEPLPVTIDLPVSVEFWPFERIATLRQQAEDPSQAAEIDWPETIKDDAIDLGPLIYETLAMSFDPYPKKRGVQFDWEDAAGQDEMAENGPFAALKGLKKS